MKTNSGNLIVVIALIVASLFLVAGVVYLFSRSSIKPPAVNSLDVSSWKTYTNKVLRYSMAYPPNWTITAIGDPEMFIAPSFESPCNTSDKNCFSVAVESDVCGKHVICNQISPQFPPPYDSKSGLGSLQVLDNNGASVSDVQSSFLAGEKAVSLKHTGHPLVTRGDGMVNDQEYLIIANHKGQTYELDSKEWHRKGDTNVDGNSKEIFDKMVNTFKFLD